MVNRRKLPTTSPISMLIRRHDGARIAGGCDYCDAFMEVRAYSGGPHIHRITVHHDDGCPFLAAIDGRRP